MLNIRRIFFICKYYAKINYTFIEKLFILLLRLILDWIVFRFG